MQNPAARGDEAARARLLPLQSFVDRRETVSHGFEWGAQDFDRLGVQAHADEGGARLAVPAGAALAGKERQHGQPVAVGFKASQLPFDLFSIQLQRLLAPGVNVPAVRERAADDYVTAAGAITPEPLRDAHGARSADVDRDDFRSEPARTDVARRAVADGREPGQPAQNRPPFRIFILQPDERLIAVRAFSQR